MRYELWMRGELQEGAASITTVAQAAMTAATAAGHVVVNCGTSLEDGGEIDHLDLKDPIAVHADVTRAQP